MKVSLGKFARSGIEARLGPDLADGVRAALRHYLQHLDEYPKPPLYPRFRREAPSEGSCVDLEVDEETREALRREGRRFGAPLELIAAHAVLIYLAHLDQAAAPALV